MRGLYLGADLGGTHFRAGLRLAGGEALLTQETLPADPEWNAADLVSLTRELFTRLCERAGCPADRLQGIGFGITGDIDPRAGTCHSMKRFPHLEDAPLAALLREQLDAPAYLLNDGLTAALGELRAGAGRGVPDFLMITLGTGIGGGMVLGGRLLAGDRGRIGKVGHQIIDLDGDVRCHCGLRGCWQSLAGKEGVLARAREAAARRPDSLLADVGDGFDLRALVELAERDAAAHQVLEETGRYVGIGLANLVKLFAPERVLIGGGIAEGNRVLLEAAQRTVAEYAIKPYQEVPVLPAALGKDAGLLGATFLAEGGLTGATG